ncbi:uncharacterized protein VTP21DRAFT_7863 [Calcarisporiella thermophila]|uniref:uncharacterized protein n=1 Tax=Calcarisporiella thermophila TaxID=911321 RepID=UPI00374306C1
MCTRCNASRNTIRHTSFECPEFTSVWQWTKRCITTITGPQNFQVMSARNLILGDLSESSRTAKHVAQITFDSVLWKIHRDRIAFRFKSTPASSETIVSRAKMDIEEAVGIEQSYLQDITINSMWKEFVVKHWTTNNCWCLNTCVHSQVLIRLIFNQFYITLNHFCYYYDNLFLSRPLLNH